VLLDKETEPVAAASPHAVLSQLENEEAMSEITRISKAASSRLDYAPEARNAKEYEWGETLLVGWPRPWGFAIVRTTPKREGLLASAAGISALVIASRAGESLAEALRSVEDFVHSRGLERVNLAVNTADGKALQQALNYGFCVRRVVLRMVFDGQYTPPDGRVLSAWLM